MKIEYKEFMMMMFVFVIILSFLALGPLIICTSLGEPPPKAKGLFSVTFFSILRASYTNYLILLTQAHVLSLNKKTPEGVYAGCVEERRRCSVRD